MISNTLFTTTNTPPPFTILSIIITLIAAHCHIILPQTKQTQKITKQSRILATVITNYYPPPPPPIYAYPYSYPNPILIQPVPVSIPVPVYLPYYPSVYIPPPYNPYMDEIMYMDYLRRNQPPAPTTGQGQTTGATAVGNKISLNGKEVFNPEAIVVELFGSLKNGGANGGLLPTQPTIKPKPNSLINQTNNTTQTSNPINTTTTSPTNTTTNTTNNTITNITTNTTTISPTNTTNNQSSTLITSNGLEPLVSKNQTTTINNKSDLNTQQIPIQQIPKITFIPTPINNPQQSSTQTINNTTIIPTQNQLEQLPIQPITRPQPKALTNVPQIPTPKLKRLPPLPPIQLPYSEYLQQYRPNFQSIPKKQAKTYYEIVYSLNLQFINEFNQKSDRTYNMGLNPFTNIPPLQFNGQYIKQLPGESFPRESAGIALPNQNPLPTLPNITMDWRCKASQVVKEGQCTISHILSAFEAVYITQRIYNVEVVEMSMQEVLACSSQFNLAGCRGGYPSGVFQYMGNFAIGPSSLYPTDEQTLTKGVVPSCNRAITSNTTYIKSKIFIRRSIRILYGDCSEVAFQLQTRALSAMIWSKNLMFYADGTFITDSKTTLHKVTIVGYDPENRFLVKNSWGVEWGINGYAYVGEDGGVCNAVIYPILDKEEKISPLCNK